MARSTRSRKSSETWGCDLEDRGYWPGRRDLRRLDRQVAARVVAALERLAGTQYGDVIRLTCTEPEWRLRVGDWRVRFVYDFEHQVIRVDRVLPRGRAYRD